MTVRRLRQALTPLLYALITVLCLGCTLRHPARLSHRTLILIDKDWDPAHLTAIYAATNEWRTKTNSIATFDIRFVDTAPIHPAITDIILTPVRSDDPFVLALEHKDHTEGNTLGVYNFPSSTIYLVMNRLRYQDDLRVVLEHELGHTLWLKHQGKSESIMYEFPLIGRRHITKNDLIAFCSLYGCNADAIATTSGTIR